jgi:hypothetical protein
VLRPSLRLKLSYEYYDFSDFEDESVVHVGIAVLFEEARMNKLIAIVLLLPACNMIKPQVSDETIDAPQSLIDFSLSPGGGGGGGPRSMQYPLARASSSCRQHRAGHRLHSGGLLSQIKIFDGSA